MARPARTLDAHVRQGSFRSRRHHQLLATGRLPADWSHLRGLQARYQAARSEAHRHQLGLEFEHAIRNAPGQAAARNGGLTGPTLDEQLGALGRAGSTKQLLGFFFPAFLQHTQGPLHGQPFQLEAWQRAFLREFHRRDRSGRRLYKKALLGLPRGNGKTPLAAGLALYTLLTCSDAPQVLFAAGSREQAAIGLGYARAFASSGPLAEWVVDGSSLTCPKRQGRMQTLATRGPLQHGHAPSAALVDELWTFTSRRQEETYTALATAVHKRPDGYLLATSTAGNDPASLLGRIYHAALNWPGVEVRRQGCLTIARNLEAGTLVWWYGAPADADIEDPRILRACNPASWLDLRELQQQLHDPAIDEADFRRLHLNQWPASRRQRLQSAGQARYPDRRPEGPVHGDGRSHISTEEDAIVALANRSWADLSQDEILALLEKGRDGD